MKFEFKTSFDKSIKVFHGKKKEELKKAAIEAIDILTDKKQVSKGVGLKRLRGNFWEVRYGLKVRILFRWQGDLVEFIIAGDHNDIRHFLKGV